MHHITFIVIIDRRTPPARCQHPKQASLLQLTSYGSPLGYVRRLKG